MERGGERTFGTTITDGKGGQRQSGWGSTSRWTSAHALMRIWSPGRPLWLDMQTIFHRWLVIWTTLSFPVTSTRIYKIAMQKRTVCLLSCYAETNKVWIWIRIWIQNEMVDGIRIQRNSKEFERRKEFSSLVPFRSLLLWWENCGGQGAGVLTNDRTKMKWKVVTHFEIELNKNKRG